MNFWNVLLFSSDFIILPGFIDFAVGEVVSEQFSYKIQNLVTFCLFNLQAQFVSSLFHIQWSYVVP